MGWVSIAIYQPSQKIIAEIKKLTDVFLFGSLGRAGRELLIYVLLGLSYGSLTEVGGFTSKMAHGTSVHMVDELVSAGCQPG